MKIAERGLEINTSRQFSSWLFEQKISISFTTYQAGKLFFIGIQDNGNLSIFERTFERCMGLYVKDRSLWISTLYQIWRFENVLVDAQQYDGYDAQYVPQMSYVTGDIDIHDIAVDSDGMPVFVNTLFSCLAKPSATRSFELLWKPPYISKLAAEDRCHLNGLAMKNGKPRYVSSIAQSDISDCWRENRATSGCLVDIESNEIISSGLSMPHSPRWYRDRLWLLNSGTGEFGFVDTNTGQFEAIAFCPGYLRGLAFIGDYALVGMSKPRNNKTFQDLPLDSILKEKSGKARCGIGVIDLRTGDLVHTLRIDGIISELYDVAVIPFVQKPMAIGFKSDEIRRFISV
ncbi:MAG: TIGR03032 family protein [Cyanobacteria bacterium P01_A01_bin.3]